MSAESTSNGCSCPRSCSGTPLTDGSASRSSTQRSNAEIAADLSCGGRVHRSRGPGSWERAEQVGAAYRHDCVSANGYFAEALEVPPAVRLSVPVTVVVAADDPTTAGYASRYGDWELLVEHVDVHEIADGGHYFLRTRPSEAAQAALSIAELFAHS